VNRDFCFHAIRVGYSTRFALGHDLIWVYPAPQIVVLRGLVCYGDNFDRGVALWTPVALGQSIALTERRLRVLLCSAVDGSVDVRVV
jgi:hypothetical protein